MVVHVGNQDNPIHQNLIIGITNNNYKVAKVENISHVKPSTIIEEVET